MSKEIGFAVVGLGMGRHHCKAIQAAPGARLVAVCDLDEERLRPTAEEYGCRAYTTIEELLADGEVEVVRGATGYSPMTTALPSAGRRLYRMPNPIRKQMTRNVSMDTPEAGFC